MNFTLSTRSSLSTSTQLKIFVLVMALVSLAPTNHSAQQPRDDWLNLPSCECFSVAT